MNLGEHNNGLTAPERFFKVPPSIPKRPKGEFGYRWVALPRWHWWSPAGGMQRTIVSDISGGKKLDGYFSTCIYIYLFIMSICACIYIVFKGMSGFTIYIYYVYIYIMYIYIYTWTSWNTDMCLQGFDRHGVHGLSQHGPDNLCVCVWCI